MLNEFDKQHLKLMKNRILDFQIIEKPGKNGQYTTFNEDGTFKQYRGSGKPHGGIERPNIKENKIDPRSPKGLPSKATVRKPIPDELI